MSNTTSNSGAGLLSGAALVIGLAVGAVVTPMVTHPVTNGAHEAIVLELGDTLDWRGSVKTDSILKVWVGPDGRGHIVGNREGTSMTYLRLYRHSDNTQQTADSITVTVRSRATQTKIDSLADTVTASVELFTGFKRDSLGHTVGVVDTLTVTHTSCVYVVARNQFGRVLTGKPFSLSSSDTTIIKITPSTACPDTTVDPEQQMLILSGQKVALVSHMNSVIGASP